MAVPTLAEAEQLLASFHLPDGIVTHSRGVSRVAAEAARLLAAAGVEVDPQLVAVAALLHDVDKPQTRDDGAAHGVAGRALDDGARLAGAGRADRLAPDRLPARSVRGLRSGWAAKARGGRRSPCRASTS